MLSEYYVQIFDTKKCYKMKDRTEVSDESELCLNSCQVINSNFIKDSNYSNNS